MSRKRKGLKLEDIPRYESLIEAVKKAKRDVDRARYKLRDLVLVSILVYTGCRLGEALNIRVEDLDFEHRTVRIRQEKKQQEFIRIVPVVSSLFWEIMKRYTLRIPYKHEKLFLITDRQARNIVYKFTKRYLRRKIRPHAIRHSYAIFVLKHTRDLEAVRRLLGHSDYKWLKVYLNYTQEDLRSRLEEAFESLG